jgi:hypothetical protein
MIPLKITSVLDNDSWPNLAALLEFLTFCENKISSEIKFCISIPFILGRHVGSLPLCRDAINNIERTVEVWSESHSRETFLIKPEEPGMAQQATTSVTVLPDGRLLVGALAGVSGSKLKVVDLITLFENGMVSDFGQEIRHLDRRLK